MRKIVTLLVAILVVVSFSICLNKVDAATLNGFDLKEDLVYTLRNGRSNLYMDVKGWSQSSGTRIQQFTWHGDSNQQFKLKKISTDVYEIIPQVNTALRVDVADNSSAENAIVKTYTANSTTAQRFKMVHMGKGAYKILTGSSNYTKVLSIDNDGTEIRDWVLQRTYTENSSDYNSGQWYFERYDTLSVLETEDISIGKFGKNRFDLNFILPDNSFQEVEYVVETVGSIDTYLELYKDDERIAYDDDSGEGTSSKIKFKATSDSEYRIEVKCFSLFTGNSTIRLYPAKELYFNSMNGSIDTREQVQSATTTLNKLGYFVCNTVNSNRVDMTSTGYNGNVKMNNDYYMLCGAGAPNGVVFFEDYHGIAASTLPDMSNVKLAVWAAPYTAATGNIAPLSVSQKNAQASIGWVGLTATTTIKVFTDKLWKDYVDGKSISVAMDNAVSHVEAVFWWNNELGWGDDTVLVPWLYEKTNSTMSLNNEIEEVNYDFSNLVSSNVAELNQALITQNFSQKTSDDGNVTYYLRKINDCWTNEFFMVDNSTGAVYRSRNQIGYDFSAVLLNNNNYQVPQTTNYGNMTFHNPVVTLENNLILRINGQTIYAKRIQMKYTSVNEGEVEYLDEKIINLQTNEEISYADYISSFN